MSASWEPFRAAPWLGPRLRPQKHSQFHVASKWMDYGLRSAVFILLFQLLRLAFLFSFLGCWVFFYLLFLVLFFVVFLTPLTPGSLLCIPFVSPIRQPSGCQFEQQNYRILKFSLFFFSQRPSLHLWAGHNSLSWLWRLWDKPDHQVCLSRAPKMPGAAAKPPLSISK